MARPMEIEFRHIGGENGVLNAQIRADGSVWVRRGCFENLDDSGGMHSLETFTAKVEKTYPEAGQIYQYINTRDTMKSQETHGRIYRRVIEFLTETAIDRAHGIVEVPGSINSVAYSFGSKECKCPRCFREGNQSVVDGVHWCQACANYAKQEAVVV